MTTCSDSAVAGLPPTESSGLVQLDGIGLLTIAPRSRWDVPEDQLHDGQEDHHQPVTLPEPAIAHAELLANGTTLIESAGSAPTLDILDAGWQVTAAVPLPATIAKLPLIRYAP